MTLDEGQYTLAELRNAGYCVAGVRRSCEATGLDFPKLIAGGALDVAEARERGHGAVMDHLMRLREGRSGGEK